jgi:hypothetical protein
MMNIIDNLVDELQPTVPFRPKVAFAIAMAMTMFLAVIVSYFVGLRQDIAAGNPAQIVLIRSATLLLLGAAALHALAKSALPSVGVQDNGWKWALAFAAAFPALTMFSWWQGNPIFYSSFASSSRLTCLSITLVSALMIAGPLVMWLRKGAPVHINRSAYLVGIASGALGAFCYNLYCPSSSLEYVGIWYGAGIAISAVLGRLIVPTFIRW